MRLRFCLAILALLPSAASAANTQDTVKVSTGMLAGTGPQASTGVREFKGIPFAQPPVGPLRWKAPQAPAVWTGVRSATAFGPRCMQQALFGDMGFRSDGLNEDCLYLNVWTPAKSANEKLPVLVYFFGGGFMAGDGSEPRYDGESMAAKGIVSITVNYRLGVFGFFAHPELTKEAPYHASGNYALLDQRAALEWVQKNVAAFGGDPRRVTIAGESAGSIAVSAQMVSPLSKNLIAGAIGESGSILGTLAPVPLEKAEAAGAAFANLLNKTDLAALRAIPAHELLEAAGKRGVPRFSPTIDGYFFPKDPVALYTAGEQAHVPLLAGWNSEEMNGRAVLGKEEATPDNLKAAIQRLYPDQAANVAKEYAATTNDEAQATATALAGDRFIGFSTWRWLNLAGKTGGQPVYRYYYSRPRPAMRPEMGNATAGLAGGVTRSATPGNTPPPTPPRGAVHSAEIEYALGNLDGNKVYAWTPDDRKVSATMEQYFANFIKTGNPNGTGLPNWPAANKGSNGATQFLQIDVNTRVETAQHEGRYQVLEKLAASPQP